jgi:uncharacterized protein (DUF934 family)
MVKKLLDNGAVVYDNWIVIGDDKELDNYQDIPPGRVLVSLKHWGEFKHQLVDRGTDKLGLIINSDESPRLVASDLHYFSVIAINFPVFTDGRGYSHARELREQFNFEGEIRAIGDVLIDQLFAMRRVGINSFILRNQDDTDEARPYLSTFSNPYQGAQDDPRPLLHR